MAYHFKAATVDDLMHDAIETLRSDGTNVSPTKGACSEIIAASLELTNPRARVSRSASRGRLFSALGELCWYLSGSARTEDIAYYINYYRRFDEDGVIFGAYGPRLLSFDGVNQLERTVQALRDSPSSRRTVIQLFDHRDLTERHKDIPCTCTLQYLLREGRLSAITYMRSNDVFRGLPHDLFCFTMLQELIARSVGVELGSYHHMVGSLHMYEEDAKQLEEFIAEGWQATTLAMPTMPLGDPCSGVTHLLNVERQLRTGVPPADVDFGPERYWADLGRLLAAYAVRKGPRDTLVEIRKAMSESYYNLYITDRIDQLV